MPSRELMSHLKKTLEKRHTAYLKFLTAGVLLLDVALAASRQLLLHHCILCDEDQGVAAICARHLSDAFVREEAHACMCAVHTFACECECAFVPRIPH